MMTSDRTQQYLRDIELLLMRTGVPSGKLRPDASLKDDLHLHPNDYYFLKLDIEDFLHKPVDIDKVFEARTISDLVRIVTNSRKRTLTNSGPTKGISKG